MSPVSAAGSDYYCRGSSEASDERERSDSSLTRPPQGEEASAASGIWMEEEALWDRRSLWRVASDPVPDWAC